ncbi:MAG TPA: GspH/FimT family pseudopilin [Thermoanaerobaculia bacterium]|jgi:prepilin-type N-terminal cleavage/methylation domain-containing protein|nr:GspH/FimT family pseudopilin [Thermoanaerobaculia bacterium]
MTMKRDRTSRAARGFTLIETLVVLVFLSILLSFAVPSLFTVMRQGKLRGAADETATLMRLARLEAIKQSCTVFVRPLVADATNPDRMEGVVDCDGDGIQDSDRKTLGTIPLPSRVHLLAPPDLAGKDSVPKLTEDPAGGEVHVAVFRGDGSVEDTGSFHFGDDFGNFLSVRVAPLATARIEVRKCLLCTKPDDGDGEEKDWYANGDGGRAWTWK